MLDVIFIALWLTNRGKARRALPGTGEQERYARRARIFGWLEIANLVVGVLIAIAVLHGGGGNS
ncbi:hypothetical protein ACFYNO_37225 [Kitasatospora sp. NPDC006697]|uniref:hypothetical protein n=1 Tax=Kitasatospora sp. NPDC006697 TaxID=3364020 RepID=UPI00367461A5